MATETMRLGWTRLSRGEPEPGEPLHGLRCTTPPEPPWSLAAVRSDPEPGVWHVSRACGTASGGSFYALLGGTFRPGAGGALVVCVHLGGPGGLYRGHLDAIRRGLSEAPLPSGELVIDRARVHLVDDKEAEWRRAARILGAICGLGWDPEVLEARVRAAEPHPAPPGR